MGSRPRAAVCARSARDKLHARLQRWETARRCRSLNSHLCLQMAPEDGLMILEVHLGNFGCLVSSVVFDLSVHDVSVRVKDTAAAVRLVVSSRE